MKTYLCTYFCSALLALIVTPIIVWIAHRLKVTDFINPRKIHTKSIPRIGGVAVFISSTALIITVLLLDNSIGQAFRSMRAQVVTLLAAGLFIFLVGLVDDMRPISAWYKLFAQIAAAAALPLAGVKIESINVANLFTINFGWLSLPITVFWITGVINAVNLIDGLDGLAAGISAVTCAIIAVFALSINQPLMVIFMLALLGSLSGFLFFNFNPARIFLGDCGSMFLGFLLGSASVMCAFKSGTIVALALPALALGLPIFDTAFSVLRRYLGRWGIMSPDRSHLHHRLLDMGLRHRHVVIIMYGITLLAAGMGMFMIITRGGGTIAIFFCVILLLILFFRLAGVVQVRDIIAKLKYKRALSKDASEDFHIFEELHLQIPQAASFRKWWQMVSDAAQREGLSELCLTATANGGRRHQFIWRAENSEKPPGERITVRLPISSTRFGLSMEIEAKWPVNGLLEPAGRRIMLFGRLLDEYIISIGSNKKQDFSTFEIQSKNDKVDSKRRVAVTNAS